MLRLLLLWLAFRISQSLALAALGWLLRLREVEQTLEPEAGGEVVDGSLVVVVDESKKMGDDFILRLRSEADVLKFEDALRMPQFRRRNAVEGPMPLQPLLFEEKFLLLDDL